METLQPMDGAHHRLVSLNGNIAPDGSASFYDVIMRLADKIRAQHYPMPLPVIAASEAERDLLVSLDVARRARALAAEAQAIFVGIGEMDDNAPLYKDSILALSDLREMQAAGAVGEIASWAYDARGRYLEVGSNRRVAGVRIEPPGDKLVLVIGAGPRKIVPPRGALAGGLMNALVTDEPKARALLADGSDGGEIA